MRRRGSSLPGVRRRDRRDGLRDLRRAVPGAHVAARRHRHHGHPRHAQAAADRSAGAAGAAVRFLPPYNSDLNPIERLFSKLGAYLRQAKARSVEAMDEAIGDSLQTVSKADIAGGFGACGYRQTQQETAPDRFSFECGDPIFGGWVVAHRPNSSPGGWRATAHPIKTASLDRKPHKRRKGHPSERAWPQSIRFSLDGAPAICFS